jgi:uncharacterized membrane protein YkvA (DUF1232 family)
MQLKERAEKLKTEIPAVYYALKDKKTPMRARIFAALAIVYALSPVLTLYRTLFRSSDIWMIL